MSYRLINANNITFNSDGFITAENIEKMPCIYADLPNGMDGEHYVLEQEPKTDAWSIKEVADALEKHGIIREQEPTIKIEESNFSQEQYLTDIQSAYDCGKSIIDKVRAEIGKSKTEHEMQIAEKDIKAKLLISDIYCDIVNIFDKYMESEVKE